MGGLLSGITFILVLTVSDLPAFIICKKWQGFVAGIAGFLQATLSEFLLGFVFRPRRVQRNLCAN